MTLLMNPEDDLGLSGQQDRQKGEDPMLSYPEETLVAEAPAEGQQVGFYPHAPQTLEDTGISVVLIEELLLKFLLSKGTLTGRQLAEDTCLPFKVVQPILADLKARMFVTHRTTSSLGDFVYALSEQGKEAAMQAREYSSYCGPVPVRFETYVESVYLQSIRREQPGVEELKRAYADILVSEEVLNTLGPAINSGRGIFLFGEPGNGKTTLAERIRNCFKEDVYIPKTLWIEGEIVQLFDPQTHEPVPHNDGDKFDNRWVKIKRPTVMVGGELTLEALDIKYNPTLKISEAPLQLKANCGTFLIDDFGRQRIDHRELLNRWIVPLEKQYDFLLLANGKKIQVPFDELIVFSTNLNPKDLVDDAFLRRIPYKIEISNPDEVEFRKVFVYQCNKDGVPYDEAMVQYLIDTHYKNSKRGFRVCHPRDILAQVINASTYKGCEPRMTKELLDIACKNYFSAMACSSDYNDAWGQVSSEPL